MDQPINNFVYVEIDYGEGLVSNRKQAFPVYPSSHIKVKDSQYYNAVEYISKFTLPCIFFDGEKIIVPSGYENLIFLLCKRFDGEVIAIDQEKGSEFATKAIELKISANLVNLGDSIIGLDGDVKNMLNKAISSPKNTYIEWQGLYLASMNQH